MTTDSASEKARRYVTIHERDKLSGSSKYGNGPCITISRETGAGANFVCDALLDYFARKYPNGDSPWTVFDKNLIDKVIEDHHLPRKIKEYLDEAKLPPVATAMNELFGVHPPIVTLIHKTAETILGLAEIGFCIIVGRGANIITAKIPHALHVRLIAPYEHRLAHMKQHYKMDGKTAADFIKKEDEKRSKFVETHFRHKAGDNSLYHLILNTGKLSFRDCAAIIGDYALHLSGSC